MVIAIFKIGLVRTLIIYFARTGTPVEVSVLIANSEISVEMGDIKKALSILRAVTTDSSYY